jgi:hypothetical protein
MPRKKTIQDTSTVKKTTKNLDQKNPKNKQLILYANDLEQFCSNDNEDE